jgi:hypothetical protein
MSRERITQYVFIQRNQEHQNSMTPEHGTPEKQNKLIA